MVKKITFLAGPTLKIPSEQDAPVAVNANSYVAAGLAD